MMRVLGKRFSHIILSAVLVFTTVSFAFQPEQATAAPLAQRSLTLQANGANGGSAPGLAVNHLFTFNIPSSTNLGSIKFEYCTTASGTCTPTTAVTTAATLGGQTGPAVGFTLNNGTAGAPYLTRTASTVTTGTTSTFTLNNVTNPTSPTQTFFVRINTYTATNATGTPIDGGTVAASTANPIQLTGTMPESLIFCTGANIDLNVGGIPDCTTATAGTVAFANLFSPTATATAISEMSASTNAGTGYVITLRGATLTSGANTIPDMDVAGASTIGAGQFGLNLVANTGTPPGPIVGAGLVPASNGTNLKALASTGFGTDGTYRFDATSNNIVAASNSGGAGPTDAQIYTASYIVNVPGSQPAGTYVTTLTYVCTPTF